LIYVQDIKKKKPERAFELKDVASDNDRDSDSRPNSDSELDDDCSQTKDGSSSNNESEKT